MRAGEREGGRATKPVRALGRQWPAVVPSHDFTISRSPGFSGWCGSTSCGRWLDTKDNMQIAKPDPFTSLQDVNFWQAKLSEHRGSLAAIVVALEK